MSSLDMVMEFHLRAGHIPPELPTVNDYEINTFRLNLLKEELKELENSLAKHDTVESFDALLDLQYVLDGAFIQLGFAAIKDKGMKEVHRSNMTKEFPIITENIPHKIKKGNNYSPPDLCMILSNNTI